MVVLQERVPFQGPRVGSCLTVGNELSEETLMLTKQEMLWRRAPPGKRAGGKGNLGGLLCHMTCSLRFYGDGITSRVFFGQSLDLGSFLVAHAIAQPRWMPTRRILGGGRTYDISFWPFLNSSGWWWLINSMFFTRTCCCKITQANGSHGAWPGWVVSISVFPPNSGTGV